MCGRLTPGYDHHCVWIDACIGAHNLGVFARGCAALAAALGVQGVLCARRAAARGTWGAEAVLACYAATLVGGLVVLLGAVLANLARGVTSYQLRRLRRAGGTPPPMSGEKLRRGLRTLCCE